VFSGDASYLDPLGIIIGNVEFSGMGSGHISGTITGDVIYTGVGSYMDVDQGASVTGSVSYNWSGAFTMVIPSMFNPDGTSSGMTINGDIVATLSGNFNTMSMFGLSILGSLRIVLDGGTIDSGYVVASELELDGTSSTITNNVTLNVAGGDIIMSGAFPSLANNVSIANGSLIVTSKTPTIINTFGANAATIEFRNAEGLIYLLYAAGGANAPIFADQIPISETKLPFADILGTGLL